jgi:uncharacterized YccA/Bax inhibitor family protein
MYFFFFLSLPAFTAAAEHPVAKLYRVLLHLLMWLVVAAFLLVFAGSYQDGGSPGTPFSLFVAAIVAFGVLVEATRFLRQDSDGPVPERLT